MFRHVALIAFVAALALLAAAQQTGEGIPGARSEAWTAARHQGIGGIDARSVVGTIAQIRGDGQGRLAILCERGDDTAVILYRTAAKDREALPSGAEAAIRVQFTFYGSETANRQLT